MEKDSTFNILKYMSDLTQEQKEEILSYQNGKFIDAKLDEFTVLPNAVEGLSLFTMLPDDKHLMWRYAVRGSFESFEAKTPPIIPISRQYNFQDVRFSAVVWKYWDKISAILETLQEIEGVDIDALVAEYLASQEPKT